MRLLMKGTAGTGRDSGGGKFPLSFISLFVLCSLSASVTPLVSAQSLKSPTSPSESKTILPSVRRVEILPVISPPGQTATVSPAQTNEPPSEGNDEGCWVEDFWSETVADAPSADSSSTSLNKNDDLGRNPGENSDDAPAGTPPNNRPDSGGLIGRANEKGGTDWDKTLRESSFFVGVMHSYRLRVEPDTRAALGGPFFKDYFRALKHLRGWSDGDNFLTNYIGHPMMGATAGRILLQNTPRERHLNPALSREYLRSRLKAFGYATAFSLQFEVGLISEATIGNAMPNQYSRHPFSYIDLVVTPTVGTAWLVGEDILERYVVRNIERWTENRTLRIFSRTFLTPTRGMANLMRLKWPWYREDRTL
jgi:hypothetical protein